MSRSYLSRRQLAFECDALDHIKRKHSDLVAYRDRVHKVWRHKDCGSCESVRRSTDEDVTWSQRDLDRYCRKVERLEREESRKRWVKRSTKRLRREARQRERWEL